MAEATSSFMLFAHKLQLCPDGGSWPAEQSSSGTWEGCLLPKAQQLRVLLLQSLTCIMQAAQPWALCQPRGWGAGGRFKREVTHVYLWLIHAGGWQRPTQCCKAIILQLKIFKTFFFFLRISFKEKKNLSPGSSCTLLTVFQAQNLARCQQDLEFSQCFSCLSLIFTKMKLGMRVLPKLNYIGDQKRRPPNSPILAIYQVDELKVIRRPLMPMQIGPLLQNLLNIL